MAERPDTKNCREQVVRALALAHALTVLAETARTCDHVACGLLGRQAGQAAGELRRAAARAGLELAGLHLLANSGSPGSDESTADTGAAPDVSRGTPASRIDPRRRDA